jgi:limonene-1,2-epoxide hydrolase
MTPIETVRTFIDRICAKDLDGACELVTDGVEYDNVPMGKQVGPQGIKDLLGPLIADGAPVEETEFVIHREAATGNIVMNERTDRFRVGDRWVELPVAGVFVVDDDGRISLWRDYFDLPSFQDSFAELLGGG